MYAYWIACLRMALEGSAALDGSGAVANGEAGVSILVSGEPLGVHRLLEPKEFVHEVAKRGGRRLVLFCADGVAANLERERGPVYQGPEFVLACKGVGAWQLRSKAGSRFVFVGGALPTTRQLELPEATSRLEKMLLASVDHPLPPWREVCARVWR